jgi:hypothetical protein
VRFSGFRQSFDAVVSEFASARGKRAVLPGHRQVSAPVITGSPGGLARAHAPSGWPPSLRMGCAPLILVALAASGATCGSWGGLRGL